MTEQYDERTLVRIESGGDPTVIPQLVATIRQQQHDLDALRLGVEVCTRDREELRVALLRAHERLRALDALAARMKELQRFIDFRGLSADLQAFEQASRQAESDRHQGR
jgi:hypothetical protein